ncbi:MAG: Segregation and condensation protein [Evtepia sp.]|jgi:segregation and condensation protein A|nr:Segregation and condensation protein [Evtepia sp.]
MEGPIYHLENVLRGKREEDKNFVGPLDLILHLLTKNKIEVKDISVAQILDQYMDWVSKRQEMDLEVASDFIAMAAHLLYIKTRILVAAKDEETLSEVELLIASLEERKREEAFERIQLGLSAMGELFARGNDFLPTLRKQEIFEERVLHSHYPDELVSALKRTILNNQSKLPPPVSLFHGVVGREPYPVEEKVNELMKRLQNCSRICLSSLWQESQSRSEIVAVFIAILELCRAGQLTLSGEVGGDQLLISQNVPEYAV